MPSKGLNFVASSLQCIKGATLFVDLPSFPFPSVLTGDSLCPDLLLETADKILYILELTIGFETNITCNAERKEAKYSTLVKNLRKFYQDVKFINLSISCLGIYDQSCTRFMDMCNDLKFDSRDQKYIISKITNAQPTTSSAAVTSHGPHLTYFPSSSSSDSSVPVHYTYYITFDLLYQTSHL